MNNFIFENKTKVYLGCPLGNYGETVMLAMSAARSSATACTTRSWAS